MSSENEEISASEINTAPPRKRVSIVWRYFEKLHRSRVKCKLCRHEQNYQGTTGNILRHLKNKHQIDATVKGQQDIPTQATRIPQPLYVMDESKHDEDAYEIIVKTEKNDSLTNTRQQRDAKTKVVSYCEQEDDSDIDPYAEGNNLDEYIVKHNESGPGNNGATATTQIPMQNNNNVDNNHNTKHSRTRAQEERILAEIEYFREKAAYYRMQKNLTALQAKKVKYELEQLG